MKKVLLTLTAAALCVSSMGALTGCGLFGGSKKVGDYDSFMAATGKNAKIELTADIDFGGAEVEPIALKSLNGNGHTIKNVKVLPGLNIRNATNTGHIISLLGEYTETVKDVVFDNITIEDDGFAKYASFVAVACKEMDKVVVKNSSMDVSVATYLGGLSCKQKYVSITADFQSDGQSPTNSGIEDCTITGYVTELVGGICTSGMGEGLYAKNLNIKVDGASKVGALFGDGSFENCYVEGCDIYAKSFSSDGLSPLHVGGLGGTVNSAKNCYVKDTKIKAEAPYYSENQLTGIGGVTTVYAGGIGAYSSYSFNAEYCYAIDNEINVLSTGSAYVGGIIGGDPGKGESAVTQCYAANNKVEAKGYVVEYRADKYTAQTRALGGIIGYAQNAKLTSSYAYGNTVVERSFDGMQSVNISYFGNTQINAGGLIGNHASSSTASDCAVSTKELNSLHNHFEVYGNSTTKPETVYTELTEEEWLDGTTLLEKLKLDAERWAQEAGKLPTIKN